MTDETIAPDVSAADPIEGDATETTIEQAPQGHVSVREAKMAKIHEARIEEREADRKGAALINNPDLTEEEYDLNQVQLSGNEGDDPAGEGEQDLDNGDGDNTQQNVSVESSPDDLPPAALNGWTKNDAGLSVRQLSVNGRIVEVNQEQYERYAQKDMAGDEKLNRAAAIEKVLTRREEAILEREQNLNAQANQLPDKGADENLDSMIDEFQEAITEGDLDVARDKMRDLIKSGRSSEPTLSMDEVVTRATTQMERNAEQTAVANDATTGYQTFKTEYSDVFADDDALAFADIQIKKLQREKPTMKFSAMALEAGRITRERLGLGGGKTPTSDNAEQLRADRAARKANLKPIPTSGKKYAKQERPAVDYSPKANIERMRAGRAK